MSLSHNLFFFFNALKNTKPILSARAEYKKCFGVYSQRLKKLICYIHKYFNLLVHSNKCSTCICSLSLGTDLSQALDIVLHPQELPLPRLVDAAV